MLLRRISLAFVATAFLSVGCEPNAGEGVQVDTNESMNTPASPVDENYVPPADGTIDPTNPSSGTTDPANQLSPSNTPPLQTGAGGSMNSNSNPTGR